VVFGKKKSMEKKKGRLQSTGENLPTSCRSGALPAQSRRGAPQGQKPLYFRRTVQGGIFKGRKKGKDKRRTSQASKDLPYRPISAEREKKKHGEKRESGGEDVSHFTLKCDFLALIKMGQRGKKKRKKQTAEVNEGFPLSNEQGGGRGAGKRGHDQGQKHFSLGLGLNPSRTELLKEKGRKKNQPKYFVLFN